MKEKIKFWFNVGYVAILMLLTIGFTYAAFTFAKEGQVENIITTGTIQLTYTEGATGINLVDVFPVSDEMGKLLSGDGKSFDFTVEATLSSDINIPYEVTAVKQEIVETGSLGALGDDEVKLYLEKMIDSDTTYQEVMAPSHFIPLTVASNNGSPAGSMVMETSSFNKKGTTINHYRLRMWVDENAQIEGVPQRYEVRVNVYAKKGL